MSVWYLWSECYFNRRVMYKIDTGYILNIVLQCIFVYVSLVWYAMNLVVRVTKFYQCYPVRSWWLLLYAVTELGSRMRWFHWHLLLLGQHVRDNYVFTWCYRNSSGKSAWYLFSIDREFFYLFNSTFTYGWRMAKLTTYDRIITHTHTHAHTEIICGSLQVDEVIVHYKMFVAVVVANLVDLLLHRKCSQFYVSSSVTNYVTVEDFSRKSCKSDEQLSNCHISLNDAPSCVPSELQWYTKHCWLAKICCHKNSPVMTSSLLIRTDADVGENVRLKVVTFWRSWCSMKVNDSTTVTISSLRRIFRQPTRNILISLSAKRLHRTLASLSMQKFALSLCMTVR